MGSTREGLKRLDHYGSHNGEVTSVNQTSSDKALTENSSENPVDHINVQEVPESVSADVGDTRKAIFVVLSIFSISLLSLLFIYSKFPHLEKDELQFIKVPRNLEDAKNLGDVLDRYKDKYFYHVCGGVFIIYIFLQTFAIPGSLFLSILSGFLFPFPMALLLVCFCSALGASICYLLSYATGRSIIFKYFPDKARSWSQAVHRHSDDILSYIIFLRITPFFPNWFINVASPVLGVPLLPFVIGTFLGVAPPSFVAIQAGTTLHKLSSSSDAISMQSILTLTAFAFLALLPVFFKSKLKKKFE